jgi:hypothetical protein
MAMHGDFEFWLSELIAVFVKEYGYTQAEAENYVNDNKAEWREYYDDDYDAQSTAYEDQLAGVE